MYKEYKVVHSSQTIPTDTRLSILGGGGTSDNLDQLASNDSLSCSVVENLELVDHLSSVLGSVVHGILTGTLLASVTLSQRPEERVGESVLAEVGENLILDLESREVG